MAGTEPLNEHAGKGEELRIQKTQTLTTEVVLHTEKPQGGSRWRIRWSEQKKTEKDFHPFHVLGSRLLTNEKITLEQKRLTVMLGFQTGDKRMETGLLDQNRMTE